MKAIIGSDLVLVAVTVYVSALFNARDCSMKTPRVLVVHRTVSVKVTSSVTIAGGCLSSGAYAMIREVHGL